MLQSWNSPCVLSASCLKQVETCAMFLMLWTCWKLTCVSSCLEQADSHPLCLFMLWTGWNLTCASSCFKAEIWHVSLHALNRLKLVVCLMLWTGWKLTCGSSCLRLKVTLCLFMLWTGWHLTCASPCFKAETHPVSLHASNRLKLMLCLSFFEINRLKVTLCLFMLWTGWHLTCASPCFKAETHPVSLHASNRLKHMLCLSCFEINRLKVTLCLFMLWTGWNLTCASLCFKGETHPMSLHALNRLKHVLYVSHALKLTCWKSPFVSSCFEQDEIWPAPPHASKGWNSSCVLPGLKQVQTCASCLMIWTGWKLTRGSSCLRLKVTLCLFMLWTRWNLSCASSCFKAETRHVSLHALNRLKLVLCPSCFEQAESWPVALHVWAESHPLPLHALNRMKSDLCLLMLQSWNSAYGSSCFKQMESCAMSLMLWTGWKLTCRSSCLRLKVTLCLFMLWTRWNLSCASSCFKGETHPMSIHTLNRLKPVLYVSHALKLTGWKSPFVSSCFEQDEIWPVPPHASKLKLGLWLFMP